MCVALPGVSNWLLLSPSNYKPSYTVSHHMCTNKRVMDSKCAESPLWLPANHPPSHAQWKAGLKCVYSPLPLHLHCIWDNMSTLSRLMCSSLEVRIQSISIGSESLCVVDWKCALSWLSCIHRVLLLPHQISSRNSGGPHKLANCTSLVVARYSEGEHSGHLGIVSRSLICISLTLVFGLGPVCITVA